MGFCKRLLTLRRTNKNFPVIDWTNRIPIILNFLTFTAIVICLFNILVDILLYINLFISGFRSFPLLYLNLSKARFFNDINGN